MRKLKCEHCHQISKLEDWNSQTKQRNKEQFKSIEQCIDSYESTELEGMIFVCPLCKKENDAMYVEEII